MEALRIISDEHQSLAAILHAVRFMLHEIEAGRLQPDFKLLKAMVHYLDAYPEKRHHPKEDEFLFAKLKARTDEGAEAMAKLELQHAGAAARIQVLETALAGYTRDTTQLKALAQAFDNYAEFYRNHMMLEEREILPLATKYLTAEDWVEMDRAFGANQDPMSGTKGKPSGEEDFAAIFSKLVAAAPAPIGLGAGPYQD